MALAAAEDRPWEGRIRAGNSSHFGIAQKSGITRLDVIKLA